MKKVKLYNYINLVIAFLYLLTILFQSVFKFINISLSRFYFPCFLIFVGLSLLFKFIIFKNESVLWFSCILFLFSGAIFLTYFSTLTFKTFWPVYIIIPGFCSFVVGAVFKNYLHLSLAFACFAVGIPLFLLTYDILSGWKFMVVLFISLLFGVFVVNIFISKLRKNRKGNYGKV